MSAGRASSASSCVRGEVLAVLEQVGAVGVERVAGEAALQLQVGEEVEDEALEAGVGCRAGLDCDGHGGWFAWVAADLGAQGTVRVARGSCRGTRGI